MGSAPKSFLPSSGLASSRSGQKGLGINFVLITLPFPGLHFHFTPGAALVTDAQTTEKDDPQVVAFWGDSLYIRSCEKNVYLWPLPLVPDLTLFIGFTGVFLFRGGNMVITSKLTFWCFILAFLFCGSLCNPLCLSLLFRRNWSSFSSISVLSNEQYCFNHLCKQMRKAGRLLFSLPPPSKP